MGSWQVTVAACCAGALGAVSAAPAQAGAQGGIAGGEDPATVTARPAPARTDAYWTPRRMREARPAPLRVAGTAQAEEAPEADASLHSPFRRFEITDTSSYPNRTHGKAFFTLPGEGDFFCSGTVVASRRASLVLTAGHCVHAGGPGGRFATRWTFVPGYRNGSRPFGTWPATRLASTAGWVLAGDTSHDVGAAVAAPDGAGRRIEDVVGARGIAFDRPRDQAYRSHGYPAALLPLAFDGERAFACESRYAGDDPDSSPPRAMALGCDMTEGASGGAWVVDGSLVSSVNSYTYLLQPHHLYGPYFGSAAAELYREVAGSARCRGREATHIGGPGDDLIEGTDGDDVIDAGPGDDRIVAGRGRDRICSGPGDDRIDAGPGADRISAGRGRDVVRAGRGDDRVNAGAGRDLIRGGRGFDRCNGGSGRDRASGCELRRRIP